MINKSTRTHSFKNLKTMMYGRFLTMKSRTMLRNVALLALGLLPALASQAKDLPGATQTSYAVSPSGAFSFQVPIIVPQGVNGVQPNLSLNFSSARGNGRVGVGWDISGLSGINRCGQTLSTHGRRIGVRYEQTDRYCLDGKPLILVSGTYGADGSEYRTEFDEFSKITVIDTTLNLDGTVAPKTFEVRRKGGSIWTYGEGSSGIKLPGTNVIHCWKVSSVKDRNNNSYHVSYRAADGQPNAITYGGVATINFIYEVRNDKRTRYFGGKAMSYNHRISRLDVKRGTTVTRQYKLGYDYSTGGQSQLQSITECGLNDDCMPAIDIAWQADAKGYVNAPASFNPKEALIEYDSQSQVTSRGVFADVNGDGFVDQVISYRNTAGTHVRKTYLGSKDGFGAASPAWNMPIELIEYTTGIVAHSQIAGDSVVKAQLVDVNADGLPDVVYGFEHPLYIASTGERTFKKEKGVYINNGNGWSGSPSTSFIPPDYMNSYVDNHEVRTSSAGHQYASYILTPRGRFMDINGDGLVDWVRAYGVWSGGSNNTNYKSVHLNTGSGWGNADSQYTSTLPDVFARYVREYALPTGQMVDVNGDGLVDWVRSHAHFHDSGVPKRGVWLNTGTKFELAGSRHQNLPIVAFENTGSIAGPRTVGSFIDLNGDGLTDYLADSVYGSTLSGYPQGRVAYLNTGRSWVRAAGYDSAGRFQHKYNAANSFTYLYGYYVDLNKDGLVDFSESYKDGNGVNRQKSWINTGSGWKRDDSFNIASIYFDHRGNNSNTSASDDVKLVTGTFADINADGSPDWVKTRAGWSLSTRLSQVGRASLLDKITTTMGLDIKPQFATLTSSTDLYTRLPRQSNGNIVPNEPGAFYLSGASYVTASLTTPTPKANVNSVTTYQYEGAQASRVRGFLGFKRFRATSSLTGLSSFTQFNQSFPYVGLSAVTATYEGSKVLDVTRSQYTHTQDVQADGTKTYFRYPTESESEQFELTENGGGKFRKTVTDGFQYDAYGNLKFQRTSVMDADNTLKHITDVTNVYEAADTTNWLVGLVKQTTQRNTTTGRISIDNTTEYKYYSNGKGQLHQVIREPNSGGNLELTTTYTYDDTTGNVTSEKTEAKDDLQAPVDSIGYDADDRLATTLTNALGKSSTIVYHPQCDLPQTVTDPNELVVSYTYDSFCRQETVTSPDGVVSETIYQAVNEACPGGDCQSNVRFKVTSRSLDTTASLIEPGVTEHFSAFNQTLITTTQGMDGREIRQQVYYDEQGRTVRSSQPYFAGDARHFTDIEYDVLGRQKKTLLPYNKEDGARAETSYDFSVIGTQIERRVKDVKGRFTTTRVNAIGQVEQVIDADNQAMSYQYDSQGNLIKTTDALGNEITLEYDILGRREKLIDPDLGESNYVYNGFSELISQTDAKNQTISMEYDELGRLVQRTVPGDVSLGGGISTWEYDEALKADGSKWFGAISKVKGLRNTLGDAANYIRTFEYDAIGRTKSEETKINSLTFNESYEYDPSNGRMIERYYPSSGQDANGNDIEFGVKYEYTNGYLSSILSTENAEGMCVEHWRAQEYDAQGRLALETVGKLAVTRRDYKPGQNVLERIVSMTARAGSPLVQDLNYVYDEANNLKSRNDAINNLTESFTYDNLDRLTAHSKNGVEITSVNYDAIGNITYKSDVGTYNYNPSGSGSVRPHAVKSISGALGNTADLTQFNVNWEYNGQEFIRSLPDTRQSLLEQNGQDTIQYDANGNATQSGNRSIAWTAFDKPQRMSAVLDANGTSSTSVYQYGPEQQRLIKKEVTVNALSMPIEHKNTTVYIGKYYERITDGAGNITHRYMIETGGATIQIDRQDNSTEDTPKYLLTDNLGSTHVILNVSADVEQTLNFDPWGMRLNVGDSTSVNSVTNRGYTGHEMDDEVGLINMNARVYDPYLARFMSADPVLPDAGDMQAFNRYSYVLGNPLKYVDPSGNSAVGLRVYTCYGNCNGAGPFTGINGGPGLISAFFDPDVIIGRAIENGRTGVDLLNFIISVLSPGGGTSDESPTETPAVDVALGFGSPVQIEGINGPVLTPQQHQEAENAEFERRIRRDNVLAVFRDLGKGLLREVTDPLKDFAEGRILSGACGVAKVCRGFGKIGELGNKAFKSLRNKFKRAKCRKCFVAGTLVHTEDGMTAIEEIEVGDLVAARDQHNEDGEIEWKEVVDFFVNDKKPIVEVTFTDDATREFKFGSTHDHPFWVEQRGWVEVQDLAVGDSVVDREGENFRVSDIVETGRYEVTYNFTVDGYHTYFVGSEGVWVHNMGDCELPDTANGAPINGNPQVTRKGGAETTHGSTSQRIANEEALRKDAQSVHLNQQLRTITNGKVNSRVRPDVATVRNDGKIDTFEVLSPGQTVQQQTNKLRNALGDRAGNITCVACD